MNLKLYFLLLLIVPLQLIPQDLNESSEFLDVYYLHKGLKSPNEFVSFYNKVYKIKDSTFKYESFIFNENDLLVEKNKYYFDREGYHMLESFEYSDSTINIFESYKINNYKLSNDEIILKFYDDSLITVKDKFKTKIIKSKDSIIIKEFWLDKEGKQESWATYTYYDNRIYSVYNEIEDDYEYLINYNGDTTFINFVLPLHPFGENVIIDYKTFTQDSTMIVHNKSKNIKELSKLIRGNEFLQEVTILNSIGIDSLTFRGQILSKENYQDESTSVIKYNYSYSNK